MVLSQIRKTLWYGKYPQIYPFPKSTTVEPTLCLQNSRKPGENKNNNKEIAAKEHFCKPTVACCSDPWREHISYHRASTAHADTINKSEWLRSQELISLKVWLPRREQAHSGILKLVRRNDSPTGILLTESCWFQQNSGSSFQTSGASQSNSERSRSTTLVCKLLNPANKISTESPAAMWETYLLELKMPL